MLDILLYHSLKYAPFIILFSAIHFQNITDQHVGVHVCIQRARIPLSDFGITCHEDNKMILNATDLETDVIYFPYPEPGSWYLAMMAYCYNDQG